MVKTFPLRIRDPHVRQLIRDVAERDGISQNELLEQAAEHELIARGALIAEELETIAARLRGATLTVSMALVEASVADFIAGEALGEPLKARKVLIPTQRRRAGSASVASNIGAVAAFSRG
jgi:hypothetical protein